VKLVLGLKMAQLVAAELSLLALGLVEAR